ncbi:MAG: AarF/ABC1/UbiB kinase family protein [Candidatus Melainabacteria bacterium]|nr:MAG: AarF/ABC1/UbiB kinase family protein [Candidatus Melainabacteria bacterium]
MGIAIGPHIKRYKDIAMLLVKYGNSDLVKNAGLAEIVAEEKNYEKKNGNNGNGNGSNGNGKSNGNGNNGKVTGIANTVKTAEPAVPAEAEELTRDIEKLGPAFIKFGQLMSTRSDLLPPTYMAALAKLQDKCEPVPFGEIEKRVISELGVRISKAFLEFDSEPVAAASLGQIHRAVLRDGRVVAVKVQRPGIRESIFEDLEILEEIANFYDTHTKSGQKYEYGVMLDEFRKSVLEELDYRKEAHNLETMKKNLEEFDLIFVPAPINDYSSSTVLTMEFVSGKKVTEISKLEQLELDGAPLAEEVFSAYLKQILVDGFFHADPHPGNVLLTDDKRIGLIDLGMVARLTPHLQGKLLQLVIAISEGRPDTVANIAVDISERKEKYDEIAFRKQISDIVQKDLDANIDGMQVGQVVIAVTKAAGDCGIRVPSELTMVGKALMNLDQVGRTLDPNFDPNASVRRNAAHIMQQRLLKDLSPGHIGNNLMEARDFMEKLPNHVNKILDLVANNKLSMKVVDEALLIDSVQKVANRISLSLILAALIIGASLLMDVSTSFKILGYPGLAIICFVAAASGGFALAVQIAFYDQKPQKLKENGPPHRTS